MNRQYERLSGGEIVLFVMLIFFCGFGLGGEVLTKCRPFWLMWFGCWGIGYGVVVILTNVSMKK